MIGQLQVRYGRSDLSEPDLCLSDDRQADSVAMGDRTVLQSYNRTAPAFDNFANVVRAVHG